MNAKGGRPRTVRLEPLLGEEVKLCRRCKEKRPVSAFTAHKAYKDGLNPWCAECRREYNNARYQTRNEQMGFDEFAEKRCALCLEIYPLSNFATRSQNPDGLENLCMRCRKLANKKIGPVMLDPARPKYYGKRTCKVVWDGVECQNPVNGYQEPHDHLGVSCFECQERHRDKVLNLAPENRPLKSAPRADGLLLLGLATVMLEKAREERERAKEEDRPENIITSQKLADRVGLSLHHIKDVRQKRKRLGAEHVRLIAEYLGCSVEDLKQNKEEEAA